ncbi:MAG: hypothetical protein AAGI53_15885 [Planctomycetota bacterium]
MPRKPASKASKRKKKADGPFDAIRWDAVRSRAKPIAIGLAILVAGLAVTSGLNAINSRAASGLGAGRAADELPLDILWPSVPGGAEGETWLPEVEQADILRVARAAVREPDPLSVRPLAQVTQALEETGWFNGAPSARRSENGAIVVSGNWRVPAAVVRHAGWDHLVSWDAMPMPRRYGPGTSNQRQILNASFAPGPYDDPVDRYRSPWPGEDVAGGLALLRLLAERGLVTEVEAIDVKDHAEGRLELVTVHNTRIEWGSAPGQWRPGQATDEERVERLQRLVTEFGRIDGGADLVRIAGAHVERHGTGRR